MNNNLIERETLGRFADALVAQKYPKLPQKYKNEIREQVIDELDDRISLAIFGELSEKQLEDLDKLLDREEDAEPVFTKFFRKNNINIAENIDQTLAIFQEEFLGGENV